MTTSEINQINEAHIARAERFKIPDYMVYGYETVAWLKNEKLQTTLYAVTTDGVIYSRKTSSMDRFNHVRARWAIVDSLPVGADFVGSYSDDCKRQTA